MKTVEVNFDGLVGPTHNYAGLSVGNVASQNHAKQASNPKEAALQGLKKMRLLMDLGIPQAVLPPHTRPNILLLRNLGFEGSDIEVLESAYKHAAPAFRAAYSAASMWTANAATVSPSIDSHDSRLHITPANLATYLHRSSEYEINEKLFKTIFSNEKYFVVHQALPNHLSFSDEGAANHIRFCSDYGMRGLQLFVYGRHANQTSQKLPHIYPARQTFEASESIARLHQILGEKRVIFAKQNPRAIDKGVFHNDVISTANQNVFLYHELAFENTAGVVEQIKKHYLDVGSFYCIPILETDLSLEASVKTYFFNSQLVTLADGSMAVIAPEECRENESVYQLLQKIVSDTNPIQTLHFIDCRQSMKNGGGPACLRLRVVLTEEELLACHQPVFLNDILYQTLVKWVERHYRDHLTEKDLLDPALLEESYVALEELNKLLKL